MDNTYSTSEILAAVKEPYWRLEYLVRSGRIRPLSRGRGKERRFTQEEYEKAKRLLTDVLGTTYEPA